MKALFWISAGLVVYSYVIYPVLLVLLASLRQIGQDLSFAVRRKERRQRPSVEFTPLVSLIFSAYNEEAVIAEKLRNCAAQDYPPDRFEILAGCDGCSDRTAKLARSACLPNARIFEFSERSGKLTVLHRLLREARGEVIVFSDASAMLDPGSIRSLVRHFSDPGVGCVCGEMRLVSARGGPCTEGLYWTYEVFLKMLESRLNLLVGASGCLYAIRQELFAPLPPSGINEDFLIPMFIRAKGYRQVYEPRAVSREAAASVRQDFHRHVRIGAGNFHALRLTAHLLSPTAGRVAFSYWSHKVLRWVVPFALPLAFLSALALAGTPFYAASAAFGSLLMALALIGHCLELRNVRRGLFSIPYYFLSMNLALLLGFVRFLTGEQGMTWNRVAEERTTS